MEKKLNIQYPLITTKVSFDPKTGIMTVPKIEPILSLHQKLWLWWHESRNIQF